jgi:hypothetical protein
MVPRPIRLTSSPERPRCPYDMSLPMTGSIGSLPRSGVGLRDDPLLVNAKADVNRKGEQTG